MITLIEYDLLLKELREIMKEGLYCEDNKLYVKCKVKYELVNLMNEHDSPFMKLLYKEMEYNE